MFLDKVEDAKKIAERVHFAIFGLPRGYGMTEISDLLPKKHSLVIMPNESRVIPIDDVRELANLCKNKQSERKFFVFLEADKMTESAQNAFLKLLEEPNDNLSFIFVTENQAGLLTTVRSRAQIFYIKKVSAAETDKIIDNLDKNASDMKKRQLKFLASGLPGELKRLILDEKYFEKRKELIDMAKILISGSAYEKLRLANLLKNDRETALEVVDLAVVILRASGKNGEVVKKLEKMEKTADELAENGNVRLVMSGTAY